MSKTPAARTRVEVHVAGGDTSALRQAQGSVRRPRRAAFGKTNRGGTGTNRG